MLPLTTKLPMFLLAGCFMIACQSESAHVNKPMNQDTETKPAGDPLEVVMVEDKTLVYRNGESFETNLFDMDFIGQLTCPEKKPFLILSGRTCRECDAGKNIYIHSPSDGAMPPENVKPLFPYPGKALHEKTGKVMAETRFFFGEITDNKEGAIWYQVIHLANGKQEFKTILAEIDQGKLIARETKGNFERELANTIARAKADKAIELPGEEYYGNP
jgi:hypothetical protein